MDVHISRMARSEDQKAVGSAAWPVWFKYSSMIHKFPVNIIKANKFIFVNRCIVTSRLHAIIAHFMLLFTVTQHLSPSRDIDDIQSSTQQILMAKPCVMLHVLSTFLRIALYQRLGSSNDNDGAAWLMNELSHLSACVSTSVCVCVLFVAIFCSSD